MMNRPIKLRDRILYTQVLTQADYVVHALTAIDVLRGGVNVRGSFERHCATVDKLYVSTTADTFCVGEQNYTVTMLAGGLFKLNEMGA